LNEYNTVSLAARTGPFAASSEAAKQPAWIYCSERADMMTISRRSRPASRKLDLPGKSQLNSFEGQL
jgi:hypothetical protein